MKTQPAIQSSIQPLGTSGDLRRRLLLHHVPLAVASAVIVVILTNLPNPHVDPGTGHTATLDHGASQTMGHGSGHAATVHHDGARQMDHDGGQAGLTGHGEGEVGAIDHRSGQHRAFIPRFIFASGYLALGLIAVTLLVGPANLLLHRRTPVSNYLSRDVGTWAAISSVAHTIFVWLGSGGMRDFLAFFVVPDGSPLLNSFGLGNWTGLVALVIVVGLLAISSDVALRKLKARIWKRLQRLNYALFALVILHAYFYGALLRTTSPFTLFLILSVIAVLFGQAAGFWRWRQRSSDAAPV